MTWLGTRQIDGDALVEIAPYSRARRSSALTDRVVAMSHTTRRAHVGFGRETRSAMELIVTDELVVLRSLWAGRVRGAHSTWRADAGDPSDDVVLYKPSGSPYVRPAPGQGLEGSSKASG